MFDLQDAGLSIRHRSRMTSNPTACVTFTSERSAISAYSACAATSIIAHHTIQRVGALTARKYARALACACTGWKVGGHATRVAELVRLYVFSIKFPGPRAYARRTD